MSDAASRDIWPTSPRYRRGMQLVNGNALVARLGKSAADLGVEIRVSSPAKRLLRENGAVGGAVVETRTRDADHPRRARRRARLRRLSARGRPQAPGIVPPCADGPGALVGGAALQYRRRASPGRAGRRRVNSSLAAPAAWAPVSLVPHRDGSVGHFPHLIERAKPGFIAVTADGRRFVNEALSYYDFVSGLLQATAWRGGCELGDLRPSVHPPLRLGLRQAGAAAAQALSASGYLKRGQTIPKLAQACGIDPDGLARTVEAYNRHARHGEDPEFGRGRPSTNGRVAIRAAAQPLRGADRDGAVLRGQDRARQPRHVRRIAHRREGARADGAGERRSLASMRSAPTRPASWAASTPQAASISDLR